MNTNIRRPFAVALGFGLLCSMEAGPSALAKELKLATFLPPTHRIVKLYEDVAKEIAEVEKARHKQGQAERPHTESPTLPENPANVSIEESDGKPNEIN